MNDTTTTTTTETVPPANVGEKLSRKQRKAQRVPIAGEEALKRVEALYGANRTLFDAYRRAARTDSSLTVETFFDGIIQRIHETEKAIVELSKHRDYIPSADYGYSGNNASLIAAHLMGDALSSAKVKAVVAKRGIEAGKLNKASNL